MERLAEQREESWEGTCKELNERLQQLVGDVVRNSRAWPRTPRAISGLLRRLVTFLREANINTSFHPRSAKGQRLVTITRTQPQSTVTSATTAPADSDTLADQADPAEPPSGGPATEVADERLLGTQLSPVLSPTNSLNGRACGLVPVEVTVTSKANLGVQPGGVAASQRVDVCSRCGRVGWRWDGDAWICSVCGQPART
jgi:hypothetical protein